MKHNDGRAIAVKNEFAILRALHRFGWLRTRDLAALVWQQWSKSPEERPSLKPPVATNSGLRMAQRTLCRMQKKRLVLSANAPNGSIIYTLAEAGARELTKIGVMAVTGKDLMRSFSSSHFQHRCIANQIAISAIIEGFRISSEREISQGRWLGGDAGIAGKKPDVLIRAGGFVWWLEVEHSRKNAKDYAKLLKWLCAVVRDNHKQQNTATFGETNQLSKIIFICSKTFKAKLCRDLETSGLKKVNIDLFITFEITLYKQEGIIFR